MALRVVTETELLLCAADGTRLFARLWRGKRSQARVWIVSPGFAKHSGSPGIRKAVHILLQSGDVLAVDHRGTGHSEGRYGFGAFEYLDVQAALDWARPKWKKKRLIGFSMGGYNVTRVAALRPKGLEAINVVSGPTKIEDVVMTLGPLTQILQFLLSPHRIAARLASGVNPFFRWDWPFRRKPSAADLAPRLTVPSHYLTGSFDWLVFPFLTRRIYRAAPQPKSLDSITWGYHAESMAVFDPEEFAAWVQRTLGNL
jgi:pimeloyl-ACP methyl ester carboxylesterase